MPALRHQYLDGIPLSLNMHVCMALKHDTSHISPPQQRSRDTSSAEGQPIRDDTERGMLASKLKAETNARSKLAVEYAADATSLAWSHGAHTAVLKRAHSVRRLYASSASCTAAAAADGASGLGQPCWVCRLRGPWHMPCSCPICPMSLCCMYRSIAKHQLLSTLEADVALQSC